MYWRVNFTAFSRCGASALRSGELIHASALFKALKFCHADTLGRITEHSNNFFADNEITAGSLNCWLNL
jgi:hypothetical protein